MMWITPPVKSVSYFTLTSALRQCKEAYSCSDNRVHKKSGKGLNRHSRSDGFDNLPASDIGVCRAFEHGGKECWCARHGSRWVGGTEDKVYQQCLDSSKLYLKEPGSWRLWAWRAVGDDLGEK